MPQDFEDLIIEPRGDQYALIRDQGDGQKTEITLSEANVVMLPRVAQRVARDILASKARPGVSVSVAAPAIDFELNADLHNSVVTFRIRDTLGGEFDFSFEPSGARILADALKRWADKVDSSQKPTTQ